MNTHAVPALGTHGVWITRFGSVTDVASAVESLNFGALWIGGSEPAGLPTVGKALAATESLTVATGIVNIWTADASAVASSYHRLEREHPGRFLLGIGVGHPEATTEYVKPYAALVNYLDVLDAEGVPTERRVLAALGPKVLKLAADRSGGAHPYLTTPDHTRSAREILGPGKVLACEHKVVLETDPERARAIGRPPVNMPYLQLRNYTSNLQRLGYAPEEIGGGGSDRLIDALVAHGSAEEVVDKVDQHLANGANHVCVHVLPDTENPLPSLRAISNVLARG